MVPSKTATRELAIQLLVERARNRNGGRNVRLELSEEEDTGWDIRLVLGNGTKHMMYAPQNFGSPLLVAQQTP